MKTVLLAIAAFLTFSGYAHATSIVGDFDGDGVTDAAVDQPATGNWFIVQSSLGFKTVPNFGGPGFIPVAGDFDGDGKTDVAVYEVATGNWFVIGSTAGFFVAALNFGGPGFVAVPGDFDGDGRTDPTVYHEQTGNWFSLRSTAGFGTPALNFGGLQFAPGGNATPAGLPNVLGTYNGDGNSLQALCSNSLNDVNFDASVSLNISGQNGASFSGTGTFTSGNASNALTFSGTTTTNGDITGTFNFSLFVNGLFAGGGSGSFNGQLTDNQLGLVFEGQFTVGESCLVRGSGVVNRG
jgi:hypothetical protein